jgi:hypothetical protein
VTLEEIEVERAKIRVRLTELAEEKKRILYANRPGARRATPTVSEDLKAKAAWLATARPKLLSPGMSWEQIETIYAKEQAKLR